MVNVQSSYEIPGEQLLARLVETAQHSRPGFTTVYQRYLTGVAIARLEGFKPPFCIGDQIIVASTTPVFAKTGLCLAKSAPRLEAGTRHKVARVWYVDGQWYLELGSLRSRESIIYPASAFQYPPEQSDAQCGG